MPIDWTKPIETIAGYPARVLSTDFRSTGEVFVTVQIEYKNCSEINYYTQGGQILGHSPAIRNRKVKREGWVNVYPTMVEDDGRVIVKVCESEKAAKAIASRDVIATVKIEWEE